MTAAGDSPADDTDWLDVGSGVWWRVGVAGQYPGQIIGVVNYGRVLALGRARALVEMEYGSGRHRFYFLPVRRLRASEGQAQAEVWGADCCPRCGASRERSACDEDCGTAGTHLKG